MTTWNRILAVLLLSMISYKVISNLKVVYVHINSDYYLNRQMHPVKASLNSA